MPLLTVKTRKPNTALEEVQGRAPIKAVIYGKGLPSQPISVAPSDFLHLYREVKYSSLFDLQIDDSAPVKALIQEVQVDPITMQPIHIDFRQIRMDQPIIVKVPFVFQGESDAVKMGGTLIKNIEEVEVECLPALLPKELVVDLSALKNFQDRITVNSLHLPEGVNITLNPEELIAFVEEPLSEEEQKKLEEQNIGDVSAVKVETEEKKAEAEAGEAEKK